MDNGPHIPLRVLDKVIWRTRCLHRQRLYAELSRCASPMTRCFDFNFNDEVYAP
jgi:hypothetical protein